MEQMRRRRGPLPRVELEFKRPDLKRHHKLIISSSSQRIHKSKQSQYEHEPNHVVSFEDRLEILHLYKSHQLSACDIAKLLGKKYSTIRSIILTFDKTGRINKLLTLSAKKIIMENRAHRATLIKEQQLKMQEEPSGSSTVAFRVRVGDDG